MCINQNDNRYFAIIGDLRDSKKISERGIIQKRLKAVLELLNERYSTQIASKFTITLGDEFQGLLFSGRDTIQIILEIERDMYPVKIRFGVGVGEITTAINPQMAIGADGPAYYCARNAVEYLKAREKKSRTQRSDIWIESIGENQEVIRLLNTSFMLLYTIKDDWTDRQREVIWDILAHQDRQSDVAKRLQISQPVVQKTLTSGRYYAYKDACDAVSEVLRGMGRNDV